MIGSALLRAMSLVGAAVLLMCSVSGCAVLPFGAYRFDEINGTVLDKETRMPIQGVVVVGRLGLEKTNFGGSSFNRPLVVKETVTDKEGKFSLPSSIATDIDNVKLQKGETRWC